MQIHGRQFVNNVPTIKKRERAPIRETIRKRDDFEWSELRNRQKLKSERVIFA
jgi:hypothetical protein